MNYMNNKKPDASHQPPPHTAQQDAEGKQAAQNPEELPNEASLILFQLQTCILAFTRAKKSPAHFL